MEKENILSKIFNKIKKGWARLGEPDIDDGLKIDADTAAAVEEIRKVQGRVHEGFVERARVDEEKAKENAGKKTTGREAKVLGDA